MSVANTKTWVKSKGTGCRVKYSPMDFVEYVMYIKDKHSSYMIDTSSVSKYFKF